MCHGYASLYNKIVFVHLFYLGSFQFVVCDSGDYTVHAMDPDVLVEWDLIEQVVRPANNKFSKH